MLTFSHSSCKGFNIILQELNSNNHAKNLLMFSNKYAKDVTHALTIQQSNFLLNIQEKQVVNLRLTFNKVHLLESCLDKTSKSCYFDSLNMLRKN